MAAVILCVDDNVLALTARQCVLEKAGYEVVSAKTATMARKLFRSRHFDLVITDHFLAKSITGDELAGQLKQIRPRTPVLWFSAMTDEPRYPQHIDGIVRKTDGLAELLRKIEQLLTRA